MSTYGALGDEHHVVHHVDEKFPLTVTEARTKMKAAWRRYVAELLGTMMFVYLVCLQSTSASLISGSIGAALAAGLTFAFAAIVFGSVSGGHFNPAVTLATLITRRLSLLDSIVYILAQIIGAFLGALIAQASITGTTLALFMPGVTSPMSSISWFQGILIESMLTSVLVVVYLMVFCICPDHIIRAMAIGSTISANVLCAGNLTGASMNPARSLGTALSAAIFGYGANAWTAHYFYWVGPIIGSILASLVFKLFLAEPNQHVFVNA